jgi:hypothetical protein
MANAVAAATALIDFPIVITPFALLAVFVPSSFSLRPLC